MKASKACVDLVKLSEGFRPRPYLCPAGVWTIGYGSTRYANGEPVSNGDPAINEKQAAELVMATLATEYEAAVNRYVNVALQQHQFDALVDFAYNAGTHALRTSTLLRRVNVGAFEQAAEEFGRWVHADGKRLQGLVTRREAERKLFLGLNGGVT